MAQHNTKRSSCLRKCDDFQGSSLARSESRLSESFSTIIIAKIIFLTPSEGGWRPTKLSMCRSCKEKVLLAPLYYTDTLLNPDTCLSWISFPNFSYIVSGDGDGKVCIWDWKTTRMMAKWKAHDKACVAAIWHPHETSKVATASWDNSIKFWD